MDFSKMPAIDAGWWPFHPLMLLALLCGLEFLLAIGAGCLFRRISAAHEAGCIVEAVASRLGAMVLAAAISAHFFLWFCLAPYGGLASGLPLTLAILGGNKLSVRYGKGKSGE